MVAHNCHGKKNKTTAISLMSRQHKQSYGEIKNTRSRTKKTKAK